jgi:hypothetical protein
MRPDHWEVLRAWLRREISRAHDCAGLAVARQDAIEHQRATERVRFLLEVSDRMGSISRANLRRRAARSA